MKRTVCMENIHYPPFMAWGDFSRQIHSIVECFLHYRLYLTYNANWSWIWQIFQTMLTQTASLIQNGVPTSTGRLAQLEHLFICHIIDSRHLKCPKIKSNLDIKFLPRFPTTTLKGMVWIQGGISYHRALPINNSMGGWCYKVDSM